MIALALLFAMIIGLLLILVYLLMKFLNLYGKLHRPDSMQQSVFQNRLDFGKSTSEITEAEKQINAIIARRLQEMERQFPDAEIQEGLNEQTPEVLIIRFKRMVYSALNLLKTEHNDDPGR
jgi:hypothetical protein